MARIRVTLHDVHFPAMDYFDWLVTGLHLLDEAGEIEFVLDTTPATRVFQLHPKAFPALRRVLPRVAARLARGPGAILRGTVSAGGKQTRFVYDIGDSPYGILPDLLAEHDLYFKAQCPTTFDPRGFAIARDAWMPYHPEVLRLSDRIRPAMLGRPLSRLLWRRQNVAVLQQWQERGRSTKDLSLFAYFGTDATPPSVGPEGELMTRFAGLLHHPNPKRGELVEGLRQRYSAGVDVRILTTEHRERRGGKLDDATFNQLAGRTWHNINVSGYRRSLPFRFIDSFLVGAAVPTDELAVRWYAPFEVGTEVIDLGQMGYEMPEHVDWSHVWQVLDRLHAEPESVLRDRSRRITERFEQLWHPRAFARYVVGEATRNW